jgi:hypothetical protein
MNTLTESERSETSEAIAKLLKVTSDVLEERGEGGLDLVETAEPLDADSKAVIATMKRAALRFWDISNEIRWKHAADWLQSQLDNEEAS